MTDVPDEIYQRPDQGLTVLDFHAVTTHHPPNPPQMLLMLKVQHDEAKTEWLQQSAFARQQIEGLARLLVHICKQNGIPYE